MHILIIPGEELNAKNTYLSVFELHQAAAIATLPVRIGFISIQLSGYLYREIRRLILFRKDAFRNIKNLFAFSKIQVQKVQGFPLVEASQFYIWPPVFNRRYSAEVKCGLKAFKKYLQCYGKPDLIHAHSRFLTGGLIAAAIQAKYGIPYVLTEHSTYYARDLVNPIEKTLVKKVVDKSSCWIVVSKELGNTIKKSIPGITKNFTIVPNVIDSLFEKTEPAQIQKQQFIFLNIASLDEKKGQEILLVSFASKFKGQQNVYLHIGGTGTLEKQLKQVAVQLGVDNQVVFLGQLQREDVLTNMLACSVFVLPSLYETFGVVLIEALACGIPVIATKCGGPENIVNKTNGLLVEPGNAAALGEAMVEIKNKMRDYDPMLIRENCIQNFGTNQFASRIYKIYKEITDIQ